jgi:deazaflavin-dependent oxidoreductase (nitroreductase family)
MSSVPEFFRRPGAGERFFNRAFGLLVGLGLGLRHNYLLQVRGRKSGKIYSTPVDVLEVAGERFLVAPRGRTQWVRNAEAAGQVTLKKGSFRQEFRVQPVTGSAKNELLKAYLDRFSTTVARYFPVPPGSSAEAFAGISDSYPVFQLQPPTR